MRKPQALNDLIEDLEEIGLEDDTVKVKPSGKMVVVFEDGKVLEIESKSNIKHLLSTGESAENFFKAIGSPEGAILELHAVEVEGEVFDELESHFDDVDAY